MLPTSSTDGPQFSVGRLAKVAVMAVMGALAMALLLTAGTLIPRFGRQVNAAPSYIPTYGQFVIDTDAGADDAVALLVALGLERLYPNETTLLGVTCVRGNTNVTNVVKNVLKTLKVAERLDVPVYQGARDGIVYTPPVSDYFGHDGMGDFDFPDPPDPSKYLQREAAAVALIRMASENPNEVTLICLGPLTNIALAVKLDPEFLSKLRRLVILGGSVQGRGNTQPGVEFNFYADPEAAYVVLNASEEGADTLTMVPWETVLQASPSMTWRTTTLSGLHSNATAFLDQAERLHLGDGPKWLASDPIAAAVALVPGLVLAQRSLYVTAAVRGTVAGGAVFADLDNVLGLPPNVQVVTTVNMDAFQQLLLDVLK